MAAKPIGILRETKPYESKVPLVPQDIAEIWFYRGLSLSQPGRKIIK
jgi:alanine dehydrogenase